MRRSEVLEKLHALRPLLQARGVIRLRLFGSHARDEATDASDIDLIADFADQPSLLDLIGIEQELAASLGSRVDLATAAGLRPRVRARVEAEAVDA